MVTYQQSVKSDASYIRRRLKDSKQAFEFGIVLGSGLGDLTATIENPVKIRYNDIPYFPRPGVKGHEGVMYVGSIKEVPIIGLSGRKHYYEVARDPNGIDQVVHSVNVLAELGVKNYFATNAVGALNLDYEVGDLVAIKSHMMDIPDPLTGPDHGFKTIHGEDPQPFQPMNNAYDADLRALLKKAGDEFGSFREGNYHAVTGKSFETELQCLVLRKNGVDIVGMSVAPEVVAARHRDMKCIGMSCVTDTIDEYGNNPVTHEEVLKVLESVPTRRRIANTITRFFELYKQEFL